MTKVLVTGGAGYIGSTLVPMLLESGYHVHVLDSFLYQENSLGGWMHHPRLEVTVGDVRDESATERLVKQADAVIPLAAIVGAPACNWDPVAATSTNLEAMRDLFGWISPGQQVVMPTTNSAYGHGGDDHHCDETSPLHPLSQYAVEKVAVESELMQLRQATSLRLATVFGMSARMRLDLLVNDFVNRAIRDRSIVLFEADFYRNFIHVRDVARLFLFALEHPDEMSGEIYNAGLSSANLTKRELCELIREQVPEFVIMEAPLHKDPDQRNYIVSNEKLARLGFVAETSIHEGIAELRKGIPTLRFLRHSNA
jgi:nucleoside-diphosphate-sugar epimerase